MWFRLSGFGKCGSKGRQSIGCLCPDGMRKLTRLIGMSGFPHSRGLLERVPPPLLVISAIVFLQISSGTVKGVITPANAMSLLFLRLALGTVVLGLLSRPALKELSGR